MSIQVISFDSHWNPACKAGVVLKTNLRHSHCICTSGLEEEEMQVQCWANHCSFFCQTDLFYDSHYYWIGSHFKWVSYENVYALYNQSTDSFVTKESSSGFSCGTCVTVGHGAYCKPFGLEYDQCNWNMFTLFTCYFAKTRSQRTAGVRSLCKCLSAFCRWCASVSFTKLQGVDLCLQVYGHGPHLKHRVLGLICCPWTRSFIVLRTCSWLMDNGVWDGGLKVKPVLHLLYLALEQCGLGSGISWITC